MRIKVLHLVGTSIVAFATGGALSGQATSTWSWTDSQDGYRADPAHHRVLFEDDNVRILEVMLAPGAKENAHVHKLSAVFVIDQFPKFTTHPECSDQVYCWGGKAFTIERPPGGPSMPVVTKSGPVGLHYATNDDTIPFHAYKIEYKKLHFEE
jgi:hypothetical protein